jgi:hypothetical protein
MVRPREPHRFEGEGFWVEVPHVPERDRLSHLIFRRKPNASHMCARIKFTHI